MTKKTITPEMQKKMDDCVSTTMKKDGCDKMTAVKTCEAKFKEKASDKFIGVFPFQFDEETGESGVAEIPDTIHLIPIGSWQHDAYGPITITASDIREFVQNFNAGIRKGVPITAGHEGMMELPAVGWIQKVEARDDGLWGTVAWTELGEEALEDRQFKFFSPEFYRDYEDPQDHQIYRNVITGGALTKAPYFKELEAVVFSEKILKNKFNEKTMTIAELLAKKMEELSDEEKAFIKEHASELTEEQKTAYTSIIEEPKAETEEEKTAREAKEKADKEAADAKATAEAEEKAKGDANEAAGLNRDGTTKVSGSEKVQISASELQILRNKADEGQKAFAELQKQKLDAAVTALTFSEANKVGKFLPKSKDTLRSFMETLNDAQKTSFAALLAELPKTEIFSELGVKSGAVEGTVAAEVEAKVNAKMSENKEMKYSDALKLVMSENKGLETRYDAELQGQQVNA